ncbi:hypothetical protein [Eubacterium aggregans]|uniref:hypothetical protein n=1 Tax=Eubacterium aggregans TaxID=81409 RepID=UPI003F3EBBA0
MNERLDKKHGKSHGLLYTAMVLLMLLFLPMASVFAEDNSITAEADNTNNRINLTWV